MRCVRVVCGVIAMSAVALAAGAVGPAVAATGAPVVRVFAGERSVVAATSSFCEPQEGGITGCRSASFAAGPGFPPALAAVPGSEVVVDAGAPAGGVEVSVSPFGGASGDRRSLDVRRIDERRWAVSMSGVNVRASIAVAYADGATSHSFLILRRIVATSGGLTSVSAYDGVVVWSQRQPGAAGDSSQGAGSGEEDRLVPTDAYYLTALVDGEMRRLPVAPRAVPFDVNLGPDRRGRAVAVYSRCAREPDVAADVEAPLRLSPSYTRGRGCDLYRFDFATGSERKLGGASTDQASEMLPSIWKDEIAFARVYEQRDGLRGRVPYLYTRPLEGGSSERAPGGSRGVSGLPGPVSVDLYGRRLSFVWNYATDDAMVSEVRLDTIGSSHRVLDRARQTGATFLSPQGADGRILYGFRSSENRDRLFRVRLTTGAQRVAGAPTNPTGIATTADGALFAASQSDTTTALIDVSDAGFFKR